jgi:hypothetical protein
MTRTVLLGAFLTLLAPPAPAKTLVDCSRKEFKRPDSARSLFLWTRGAEEKIKKAKKQGVFGKRNSVQSVGVSKGYCARMISFRGSAHCKEPQNVEYRTGLARLIKVCNEAAKPPATSGGPVDCKDKRFKVEGNVDLLLRWTDRTLKGLDTLRAHEGFRVKVKCDQALKYAGGAYCKAPKDPRTKAAVARVRRRCANAFAAEEAKEAKAKQDEKDRKAAAKANRKIVRFPRSTYRGGDAAAVARQMKRALLKSRLAKSAREILKVQPMGGWKTGRYRDTKVPFKKITGLVLWWDKDKDGVCRFVSYNFIKDRGPLKAKSFCMGCLEGWTRCK